MDFPTFSKRMNLHLIKTNEFFDLLLGFFGKASLDSLPGVFCFEKNASPEAKLKLGLDKNGNIKSFEFENITSEDFIELEKLVKSCLVENQIEKFGEVVLFSKNLRITGYYKYKDEFQILPIPKDAPVLNHLLGEHPFILQYRYISSPDGSINIARMKYRESFITRRLNLLLRGRIQQSPIFTQFAWAYGDKTESDHITSKYVQKGYTWPGRKTIIKDMSALQGLEPIGQVPPDDYYEYTGLKSQTEEYSLLIPENLSASVEKIEALSVDDKNKFDMACSWFYQSNIIWSDSHSLSFIGLVTALESLFDKHDVCKICSNPVQEKIEVCESCGEPKFKITKTLMEFLDNYVQRIKDMPKEKIIMYKTRSGLAHGISMFSRDIEPGYTMKPLEQEQAKLSFNIKYIVFTGILNWLWAR